MRVPILAPFRTEDGKFNVIYDEREIREVSGPEFPEALRLVRSSDAAIHPTPFHLHEGKFYVPFMQGRDLDFMITKYRIRGSLSVPLTPVEVTSALVPREFRDPRIYNHQDIAIVREAADGATRDAADAVDRFAEEILVHDGALYRRSLGPCVGAIFVRGRQLQVVVNSGTRLHPILLPSAVWPDFIAAEDELAGTFTSYFHRPAWLHGALEGDVSVLNDVRTGDHVVLATAKSILRSATERFVTRWDPAHLGRLLALSDDYRLHVGTGGAGMLPADESYVRAPFDQRSTEALERHFDPILEGLGDSVPDRHVAGLICFAKTILAAERRRMPAPIHDDEAESELSGLRFN